MPFSRQEEVTRIDAGTANTTELDGVGAGAYRDQRVGPLLRDGHRSGEVGGRDPKPRDVQQVLPEQRIGVEVSDPVIAKVQCRVHEQVVAVPAGQDVSATIC